MEKHAYLIMAHQQFEQLKKLLLLLDDPRNDIYLHIDKKAKDFNHEEFDHLLKYSKVYYIPRKKVSWGAYSQIETELRLLKAATPNHYLYYHLLSGSDLPLKTPDYIYNFFEENQGKEFVHFCTLEPSPKILERISIYHPFQQYANIVFFRKIKSLTIRIERRIKTNRLGHCNFKIAFGANWFSITDKLANYVLSQEGFIKKHFSTSRCADELFLQTLVYNSEFKDHLYLPCTSKDDYHAIQRLIDWQRGNGMNPYVFRMEDFELLKSSEYLFARKFDSKIDYDIINSLFDYLTKLNHQTN